MEEKKRGSRELSPAEVRLLEQVREQPQMLERFLQILEIANSTEGPFKNADKIEERVIEEMRQLGNLTMTEWATQMEERVGQELQAQEPKVVKRKKNANLVVHFWGGRGGGTDLEQPEQKVLSSLARTAGGQSTRKVSPLAADAH